VSRGYRFAARDCTRAAALRAEPDTLGVDVTDRPDGTIEAHRR
jgi:hypothetical protein